MALISHLRRRLRGRRRQEPFVYSPSTTLLAEKYPQYEIGRGSYGDLEILWKNTSAKLKMGDFCSVARGVQVFLGGEHRPDWVTTYPFSVFHDKFRDRPGYPRTKGDVTIGNDVWICHEALILSGVTIGDGAVIGARAVVARDVPPYAVVGGNPAKITRMRFPEDIVARLLAVKWWDWPGERIGAALPLLLANDIAAFLDAAEAGTI